MLCDALQYISFPQTRTIDGQISYSINLHTVLLLLVNTARDHPYPARPPTAASTGRTKTAARENGRVGVLRAVPGLRKARTTGPGCGKVLTPSPCGRGLFLGWRPQHTYPDDLHLTRVKTPQICGFDPGEIGINIMIHARVASH